MEDLLRIKILSSKDGITNYDQREIQLQTNLKFYKIKKALES
jgi:hypothetical protein